MRISSIQVGMPRSLPAVTPSGKPWLSSIQKDVITHSVWVHKHNIDGDGQADLEHHGGEDKAICVYPKEHFEHWNQHIGRRFEPGDFGENLTTSGMLETDIHIGDIYQVGSTTLQVTQPRQPCWKLARRWGIKDFALRVQNTGRTGWYFRVLKEGTILAGDQFNLKDRLSEQWSIAAANAVMYRDPSDFSSASQLAECPGLSQSWLNTLNHRVKKNAVEDSSLRLFGSAED